MAGSTSGSLFTMLNSLMSSTLNLTMPKIASFGAISFSPSLLPSVPYYLTCFKLMVFFSVFTSTKTPSYLRSELVISDSVCPIMSELIINIIKTYLSFLNQS